MKLELLVVTTLVGLTLGLAGCGYSCEDLCEDSAECDGSTTNPDDCDPLCEVQERINEDFGCEDEFDVFLECAGEVEDVCDEDEDACSSEAEDYVECMLDYCLDHPNNDDCSGTTTESG